ncbi:hypothetical protein [Methanobacterium spitsbergense]|uniref:Uncharacterized protein n=1 Tax=Methanobacterium spitsbergense TaxID=2874285 RepID=A0A8T5V3Y8_9EURY|nr:hypothetical protein [Methanobacterium spitsbergense]MBZ2166375.1 hypothetical protein [Methanobacterium spitsbergense]
MNGLLQDINIDIDQTDDEKSIDELLIEFGEVKEEISFVKDKPKSSEYHRLFDTIHDLNNRIKIKVIRG